MYERRPHPLQSFKFWFLALACVGATTAWKMGWLAELTTPPSSESPAVAEVGLDHIAPPDWVDDVPKAPASIAQQSEPIMDAGTGAHVAHPQQFPFQQTGTRSANAEHSHTHAANHDFAAPAHPATPASPFGKAQLEFRTPEEMQPQSMANQVPTQPRDNGIQRVSISQADFPSRPGFEGVENAYIPQPTRGPLLDLATIDAFLQAGQDVEAHRKLSALYWEHPESRDQLRERIEQTARRIYFQPRDHYADPYTVQPGDMLQNIARDYKVSWEYLAKLNRTDPNRIRAGQSLKVIRGPFHAVVDLSRYELTVHAHGYFVASFPIGIGRDSSTPVGSFKVTDKVADPVYYGPDRTIAADDPTNPLGEHWIAIGDGYGIHGTIDPNSIGRAESRGCIRLRDHDIADLYDLLTPGSEVVIRR